MTDSLELVIAAGATPSNLSLPELEKVIERGQQTFIEVGRALMEIRDRRLYRETHATFEAYCRERWGWGHSHVNRQMDAARVAAAISPTGEVPANEYQARAMLDRLEPQEREQVRQGAATPTVVRKMTEPIRRPKSDASGETNIVIETVRRDLTKIRETYAIVSYWQPVWDAIDELNKGSHQ